MADDLDLDFVEDEMDPEDEFRQAMITLLQAYIRGMMARIKTHKMIK